MKRITILFLPAILLANHSGAQDDREANCFRHFQETMDGDSKVNAYLLSYVTWLSYAERLGREENVNDLVTHVNDDNLFRSTFRAKFAPMLHNPVPPKAPLPPHASGASADTRVLPKDILANFPDIAKDKTQPARPSRCIMNLVLTQAGALNSPASGILAKSPKELFAANSFTGTCKASWDSCRVIYDKEYNKYSALYDKYKDDYDAWKESAPYINFIADHSLRNIGIDPEVMILSSEKFIIVCFRGTSRVPSTNKLWFDWGEWVGTDLKAPMVSPSLVSGKVHQGFWQSVNLMISRLDNEIKSHDPASNKQIWITGHSLGGAEAEIYTDYLLERSVVPRSRLHCYTFGGPSFVGDQVFANKVKSLGNKMQRFEYQMDMVTIIPPGLANALSPSIAAALGDGCVIGCSYAKSGQRNWFSSPQDYHYEYRERDLLQGDIVTASTPCDHNPNWYVRAIYNQLNSSLRNALPVPAPYTNLSACNPDGTATNILPPSNEMVNGTYLIKCAEGGKYLDFPSECLDKNCLTQQGCKAQLWSMAAGEHNRKFRIEAVSTAILNGYTIKSTATAKVLDANTNPVKGLTTSTNGCIVQLCDRLFTGIRTNQEWYFERLADTDKYVIRCIKDDKVLDADDCTGDNGCKVILNNRRANDHSQEWILEKVN